MSKGVNDDIYLKVVTFKNNNKLTILIMLDLIGVDKRFVEQLEKYISDSYGESTTCIVSTTHTHSGPVGTLDTSQGLLEGLEDVFGKWNQEYVEFLYTNILKAIKESVDALLPCRLKLVDTEVTGVTGNRNGKDSYKDNRLFAMELTNVLEKKMILCHFSCHLTILDQINTLISKDLAYGIERELLDYDFVGYLNGAAGDLSTRYTREDSSVKQIINFGKEIANELRQSLEQCEHSKIRTLQINKHMVKLKTINKPLLLKSKTDKADAKKKAEIIDQVKLGRETQAIILENTSEMTYFPVEVFHIQINQYHFFTFPGELYSSLIKNTAYKPNLRIIGYTNGYCLYLPDNKAYITGNYEALSSPFEKGQGEYFADYLKSLL